jgi:deoxyribonuclease-4
MRVGVHTRIARGLDSAIQRAEEIGCEAIQIFSSNPNAWKISELSVAVAESFKSGVARLGLSPVVLHTPYLLNLASPKQDTWIASRSALASALDRAKLVGGDYVVTHIGSHGGSGYEFGADRVAEAVTHALHGSDSEAMVLLEAGSGSGNTIGSTLDELAGILQRLPALTDRVGVCLDTAHLWGAGYDVSTGEKVDALIREFDTLIGIERLKLVHLNDTLKELGSRVDRHWHIGMGKIGPEGFRAIVNHPALRNIGGILETPESEMGRDEENLTRLKSLRT